MRGRSVERLLTSRRGAAREEPCTYTRFVHWASGSSCFLPDLSSLNNNDICTSSSSRLLPFRHSDNMAPRHAPLFVAFMLLFARAYASSTSSGCYRGDGVLDTDVQPCPGSNMCCYLNRGDGIKDDVCIQGACLSNYWKGEYFVVGCTNPNWDEEGSGCSPLWDACGTHEFSNIPSRTADCGC
jgi:hypothetical protein